MKFAASPRAIVIVRKLQQDHRSLHLLLLLKTLAKRWQVVLAVVDHQDRQPIDEQLRRELQGLARVHLLSTEERNDLSLLGEAELTVDWDKAGEWPLRNVSGAMVSVFPGGGCYGRRPQWAGSVKDDCRPVELAIGITTAPRQRPLLAQQLVSMFAAGCPSPIEIFAEPGTARITTSEAGLAVDGWLWRESPERLGCWPNWLRAADWLLTHTEAPYIMICEDDVEFCPAAFTALYAGINQQHADVGVYSLFNPIHNYLEASRLQLGWHALNDRGEPWGTQAMCFPRKSLERALHEIDRTPDKGTDHLLWAQFQRLSLKWYTHAPSLVEHLGVGASSISHPFIPEMIGAGYDPSLSRYGSI